jgi:hypothetical protein
MGSTNIYENRRRIAPTIERIKKSKEISAENKKGKLITIDVKGLKEMTNWPLKVKRKGKNHFFILVTYKNKIDDVDVRPTCFIIPSEEAEGLLEEWTGRPDVTAITYHRVKGSKRYKENWGLLEEI